MLGFLDYSNFSIIFMQNSGFYISHHIAPYLKIVKHYTVTLCNNTGFNSHFKNRRILNKGNDRLNSTMLFFGQVHLNHFIKVVQRKRVRDHSVQGDVAFVNHIQGNLKHV